MRIDVGVYTPFRVNLTEFDFTGRSKVILTIKNHPDTAVPVIVEREYTEAKAYDDVITPEESIKLRDGAMYDFDEVMEDGRRYKICDNHSVVLRRGCGKCPMN